MIHRILGSALLLASACADPSSMPSPSPLVDVDVDGDDIPSGWRAPDGPCRLEPEDPTRLVLTTTDFSTGALTVVDLARRTVDADVAESSDDAILIAHDDRLVVVHRFNHDRIDVRETTDWSLIAQHGLASDASSSNPHGIAFGPEGLAYVTLFADPALRVLDLDRSPAEAERARIDLSGFADDDGNPEASLAVACGDLVLVTAQRLDAGFTPHGTDMLLVVDPASKEALDLEPDSPEPNGLPLLGEWVRQLRHDPADPEGQTLLALSRGIERIELSTGRRHWAVTPEAFAHVGIDQRLLPQSFDVDDRGALAYLAAYDPDFSQVRLYRVALDGGDPSVPEPFADGFDSAEHTLELVGNDLWYGSTRAQSPGLWLFDVGADPPVILAGPLPTGLPPYSMVAIP